VGIMRIKPFEALKKRFDSLVDPSTARGSSIDKTARLKGNNVINSNAYNLGLYIASGFVQNIVNQPAEDITREWITIKTNIDGQEEETEQEKDVSSMIEERLEEIELRNKVEELVRYSRMFAKGSFLYYGIIGENIQNRDALSKPLPSVIESIDFINVIDDPDRVSIQVPNSSDPLVKDYNQPTFSIGGFPIHPSRLSWLINYWLPSEKSGLSVIQTIKDGIIAQDNGLWSTSSILGAMALKIFTSDEIAGLSAEQKGELLAKIKHLLDTQSVMALKSDEKFEQLVFSIPGIKEIFENVFDNLSGLAKIPKKIMLGQAHGIVTGAEYDTLNYYNEIARQQELKIRPIIKKVVDMVVKETRGKIYQTLGEKVNEIKVDFDFNTLWKLDPVSQAEADLKRSQRDQIDVTIGKCSPAELRSLDDRYKDLGAYELDRNNLNFGDPEIQEIANKKEPEEEPEEPEEEKKTDSAEVKEKQKTNRNI
jgi:uncharacterized protein